MAVQYAPMKLRVPPGFQNLLEGLAREVLREQPEDIINFAAQYFKNQLLIREGTFFFCIATLAENASQIEYLVIRVFFFSIESVPIICILT